MNKHEAHMHYRQAIVNLSATSDFYKLLEGVWHAM